MIQLLDPSSHHLNHIFHGLSVTYWPSERPSDGNDVLNAKAFHVALMSLKLKKTHLWKALSRVNTAFLKLFLGLLMEPEWRKASHRHTRSTSRALAV